MAKSNMARRPPLATDTSGNKRRTSATTARRVSASIDDAAVRKLGDKLGEIVHTHTSRIPQGALAQGAVTDPATLAPDPESLPYVCGATTLGYYRLATNLSGRYVSLGTALSHDVGLHECTSRLDLALIGDTKRLITSGLSSETAQALCDAGAQLQARAPTQLSPDQPVLFFEAGGESIAITPVTPVVVLQQLHARAIESRVANRGTLRVKQGGTKPHNIASYVAASPTRDDSSGVLRNINARYGHYLALRGRFPLGVRSGPERALARMVAARALTAGGTVARQEARALARRITTAFLLPGAAMRPPNVREVEQRHAGLIADQYLRPLLEAKAWLSGRANTGFALDRLPSAERAWLLGTTVSRRDADALAEGMAADVARRVSRLAHVMLPPATRQTVTDAFAARLR